MKCNVCSKMEDLLPHPFLENSFLCPDHSIKREPGGSSKVKPLEHPIPVYVIDEMELKAMRMDGLLPSKTYVYMALMIDNPSGAQSIDMRAFCSKWGIPAHSLLQAIGQLSGKGLLNIRPQDIAADVLTRGQRESALVRSLGGVSHG